MELSICTDVGRVRTLNEDSYLAIPPWCEPALSAGVALFAVADGMGGHAGGEIASTLAINALKRWLASYRGEPLAGELFEAAFGEASVAVFAYAKAHPELSGMGTTLTAMLVKGAQALIGHVGDSRAYLLRRGVFTQVTHDHTLVAEQVRAGRLKPEEAHTHPARHILSRAMGVREFITIDTHLLDLQQGDVILLCTDGVTGMVSDQRLAEALAQPAFRKVGRAIVGEANQAGGTDNSTVVAVLFDEIPVAVPGRFSFQRLKQWFMYWGCAGAS